MNIEALDIETYTENEKIIPFLIAYSHKSNIMYVYRKKKEDNILKKAIESIFDLMKIDKKNKIYYYVHNINFDGILLIDELSTDPSYKINFFARKSNLYNIEIIKNDLKILIKCSYKLLPMSLKKIAESFNLAYKKKDFPHFFSSFENLAYAGKHPLNSDENFDFKKESIDYCINDVVIVINFVRILSNIIKNYDIDIFSVNSASSLSFKLYIENFLQEKIKFKHNFLYDQIIRPSYFGGRCEVYGNADKGDYIYHFDFSGMYAQVMKDKLPYGKYKINANPKNIHNPGFYWIEYYSNMEYPILPHKNRENKKLMFCNGKNSGIFWFEEILLFIQHGGIINKIIYSIEFEEYGYVFKNFVEHFEKIKKSGGALKTFAKLIINSLYGILGMDSPDTITRLFTEEKFDLALKHTDVSKFININNYYLTEIEINYKLKKIKEDTKKNRHQSNVALASAITSKARIKLYKAQQAVIESEGRLLYSDTDSIFAAYKKNVDNATFGEVVWDINKPDTKIKKAVFIAPKCYAVQYYNNKEIIKIKGYNNNEISYDQIEQDFYNEKNIYLNNQNIIRKDFFLKEINNKKIYNLNSYDKRIFYDEKKKTKPVFI